ncbi:hypothetical protein C7271_12395 [filamentous cyanobacterium CCP5]|nr:hypothetical protein C7271_12395 [filamentous cyanobacterium CCP5]
MFALPVYRYWPLVAVLVGWGILANAAEADPGMEAPPASESAQSLLGTDLEAAGSEPPATPVRSLEIPSQLRLSNSDAEAVSQDALPVETVQLEAIPIEETLPLEEEAPEPEAMPSESSPDLTPDREPVRLRTESVEDREDLVFPADEYLIPHPINPADLAPEETLQITLTTPEDSTIPANNRSTLTLAGQLLDAEGLPVAYDVVVTLTTSAGEFVGADYDPERAGFQVLARQGQYQAVLRSGLEAQTVRLRAAAYGADAIGFESEDDTEPFELLEAYTRVAFTTDLRPSLFAGVLDFRLGPGGSDFWDSFRDYLSPDAIGDTEFDVDVALFGTGTLGEWSITGAYNSDRALNENCDGNRLYRDDQFCEQTYPVYGDSSQTDYLTPSIDSLYLRLQRDSEIPGQDPDYAMWGDFDTQEFSRPSQDFTATIRQLHGFKGNYSFGPVQLTAMYANNLRPFQRDTIVPDGTSGYYFLSFRQVLAGSENVFIETEELNRPGTVIDRVPLSRGADYQIDYDRGSLLFRQPVLATDVNPLGSTLVRRIVVTYQVDGIDNGGDLYAGRLQYNFDGYTDEAGWAGLTLLEQDQGVQDFSLYGFDVLVPLGENGQLVSEFAYSDLTSPELDTSGQAFRIEADGTLLPNLRTRAYFRTAGSGFRNTAAATFRPGQTRWGGSVDARVGPDTQVRAQFDQESNFGPSSAVLTSAAALLTPGFEPTQGPEVSNRLSTLSVGIQQQFEPVTLAFDYVHRSRTDWAANVNTSSHQLVSRLNWPLTPDLTFLAQNDLNISSEVDPLYPTRTVVGFEYDVEPGVKLRLAQQFLSGPNQPGSITSLDTLIDHPLDDNTSLTGRYSVLGGFNGITGQGAIGLNHRMTLAPGLRANFSLERIFSNGFEDTGSGERFAQPYAVGSGAYALGLESGTAYAVGLEYTDNPDFQASARFEHRDSDNGDNTVISAAAAGRITDALTGLMRFQHANFANQTIEGLADSIDFRLGLAYRNPESDRFNGLLSYEFRQNPSTSPLTLLQSVSGESYDHTLAMEGIYAPNWQWEFYGKYAMRYGNTSLDDFSFGNFIHLGQLRASYRFAYHWDVLGEVRLISQPAASYTEVGTALEVGYYLTPDLRLGVGYSFGSANDGSFGGSGYRSASGPYLGVSMKINQLFDGLGLQPVAPPQQQESTVEASAAPPPGEAVPEAAPETDAEMGLENVSPEAGGLSL